MSPAPIEQTLQQSSSFSRSPSVDDNRGRFAGLRGVQWRINLGVLPSSSSSSPSPSINDLRRATADFRRRYAGLRRRLLVDPHVPKDGSNSPNLVLDNPLSQNPDSTWSRFFRNAELEKMVDEDLSRLYPEHGNYFQTPGCQGMLRRILLMWCLRHPDYGYRQGIGHDTVSDSIRSNTRDEENGESRENSEEKLCGMRVSKQNIRRFLLSSKWVTIFKVSLIIQVSLLDPLFFFIPVINDRQECVRLDKKLGTAVMVFRSLIDSFYVMYIYAKLHKHFLEVRPTGKYQYTRLGIIFLIDFLAVLPLPQVVILKFIPAMRGSRFLNAMYLFRSVVLCQFVPRSFRAFLFITSGTFGGPAKAILKFSPLIYMLGIDVIGAFWYFLSIEQLVQCWTKGCETLAGCVNSFYCKDNIDHTSLNHLCRRDGQKTDFFDFGIFSDALESRVLEIEYFPKKFLYCFRWSLQNLSGFGQNLKASSTYIWENVLAISIIILGMLLFLLLIGNLQAIFESRRKEKKGKNTLEAILNLPPFNKLPENLQQNITKHLKYSWEKYSIDVGMVIRELPTDLRKSIERTLGLELLKEVTEFKGIGQDLLDDLSKSTELKLFYEGEDIVQKEKTTNDMVFILDGNLEAGSSLNDRKQFYVTDRRLLYGGEVTWDFNYRVTETVKALTRVIALVLPARIMRDFLYQLPNNLKRSVRHKLSYAFFEKVKAFKHIGQEELNDLSESIEMKIFNQGEYIVQHCFFNERGIISDMVYIVQGEAGEASSQGPLNVLKDGDICGQLVGDWSSDLILRSDKNSEAVTTVHALVLPAERVRDLLRRLPPPKEHTA